MHPPAASSLLITTLISLPSPFVLGATMFPARPKYALQCLPYPPTSHPGINPKACDPLFATGIRAISPTPDTPFLFTTNSSRAPAGYGPVPFTISSADIPHLYPTNSRSPSSRNGTVSASREAVASTNNEDECLVTFRFQDDAPPGHEESWHTRLLLQNTLVAWGNCIAHGPPGEARWGRIVPKPGSAVLRLVIEVQVVKDVGRVLG